MNNVNVKLNIVSPNGLGIGSQFEIEVRFVDVRRPDIADELSVFSGYADINFDPLLMKVDSIEHNGSIMYPGTDSTLPVTTGDFPLLQTGSIDNVRGIVEEVGGTANSLNPRIEINPVFKLHATVLAAGPITITADAGEDVTSAITVFGADEDQDGVGRNAVNKTHFGHVSENFECFLTGTLIATKQGEVPVETLKIGDLVQTADGTFEKVKWVGHQTFNRGKAHPFRTYPIWIKAGALGAHLPTRDLYVSPDHALLIDGLLINAGALTNEHSITQIRPENDYFVYYHIELEHHALLVAEGTPAESYLPQNQSRDTFDNGAEYEQLYPSHNILSLLPMHYPRVSSKRQLPRFVAKRLNTIAMELGYDHHQSTEQMTQILSVSA